MRQLASEFPSVVVCGMRQCGKSTLVRHAFPDHVYITFDDPEMQRKALDDPEFLLSDAGDAGLILDEIQYVPQLLPYLKMRIDARRKSKGRFILTGSQNFSMMKGVSESLAGRVGIMELQPFSMEEVAGKATRPTAFFQSACLRGLFPEMVCERGRSAEHWYASYIRTYLERDIRSLYDIGSIREFERFMKLLAGRTAQLLNMSTIANDIGIAVSTVRRWISVLEACQIIYLLQPWHSNLGNRLVKTPKVYFLDCGIVSYLTHLRDADHLMAGPLAGAMFETFCIQEALKVACQTGGAPEFFFYRDQKGLEVDLLVVGKHGKLIPFEFKLSQTPKAEMGGGIERFQKIHQSTDPSTGHLISLSEKTGSLTRSVQLTPVTSMPEILRKTLSD